MFACVRACSNTLLLAFDGPPPEPWASWAGGMHATPLMLDALLPQLQQQGAQATAPLTSAVLSAGAGAGAGAGLSYQPQPQPAPREATAAAGAPDSSGIGLSLAAQAALSARTAAMLPDPAREAQAARVRWPTPLSLLRASMPPDVRELMGLCCEVSGGRRAVGGDCGNALMSSSVQLELQRVACVWWTMCAARWVHGGRGHTWQLVHLHASVGIALHASNQ